MRGIMPLTFSNQERTDLMNYMTKTGNRSEASKAREKIRKIRNVHVKASPRQAALAREIIANAARVGPRKTKMQMVIDAGYDPKVANAGPTLKMQTQGVRNELERLGFCEDGAKKVVEEIMYDDEVDPGNRLKATDQVFKVMGSYAPEKRVNVNLQINQEERDKILKISNDVFEKMTHDEING
jgi:hypothetical protein